jgi:hypothetical protein
MVTMMLLAALTAQEPSRNHVRASAPKIRALMDTGLARSATFRWLVKTLGQSDVIVYVEPKRTRQALGGYLAHSIVTAGGYRYLRVAIEVHGADGRLVPLLAHELQHAVEVSQDPEARDADGLERLFSRLAIMFGCAGSTCSETQAAKDIEATVRTEIGEAVRSAYRTSKNRRVRRLLTRRRPETCGCPWP